MIFDAAHLGAPRRRDWLMYGANQPHCNKRRRNPGMAGGRYLRRLRPTETKIGFSDWMLRAIFKVPFETLKFSDRRFAAHARVAVSMLWMPSGQARGEWLELFTEDVRYWMSGRAGK